MNTIKHYLHSAAGEVCQRLFAATFLGYALANTLAILLAITVSSDPKTAAEWGELSSFLFFLLIFMWAFSIRSVAKLWIYLALAISLTSLPLAVRYLMGGSA